MLTLYFFDHSLKIIKISKKTSTKEPSRASCLSFAISYDKIGAFLQFYYPKSCFQKTIKEKKPSL